MQLYGSKLLHNGFPMNKEKKEFDCVEMMHQGAEKVLEEIKDMTLEQEVEYWKRRTEELRAHQKQLRMIHEASSDYTVDKAMKKSDQ